MELRPQAASPAKLLRRNGLLVLNLRISEKSAEDWICPQGVPSGGRNHFDLLRRDLQACRNGAERGRALSTELIEIDTADEKLQVAAIQLTGSCILGSVRNGQTAAPVYQRVPPLRHGTVEGRKA
jgi:hypothetical protein